MNSKDYIKLARNWESAGRYDIADNIDRAFNEMVAVRLSQKHHHRMTEEQEFQKLLSDLAAQEIPEGYFDDEEPSDLELDEIENYSPDPEVARMDEDRKMNNFIG